MAAYVCGGTGGVVFAGRRIPCAERDVACADNICGDKPIEKAVEEKLIQKKKPTKKISCK